MTTLHPQYIKNNNTYDYVILPFDEYKKIEEMLEDYEDLIDLREAKKSSQRDFVTLEDLKKSLDIS